MKIIGITNVLCLWGSIVHTKTPGAQKVREKTQNMRSPKRMNEKPKENE